MKMKKRVTSFLLALLMAVTLLGNGPSVYAQTADGPAISAEETTNEMAEDEALLATPSEAEPSEEPEETEEQPEEVVETAEKKEETSEEAAPEEPELSETEVPENGMPVATPSELMFRAAPLLTEYRDRNGAAGSLIGDQASWYPYYALTFQEAQFNDVDPLKIRYKDPGYDSPWVYCINAKKKAPDNGPNGTDNPYDVYLFDANDGAWIQNNYFQAPHTGENGFSAAQGVFQALYRGFPHDTLGLKDKYNLSDWELYAATQMAIHFWTDEIYQTHAGPVPWNQNLNKAFFELIDQDSASGEEFLGLLRANIFLGKPSTDGTFTQRVMWLDPVDEEEDNPEYEIRFRKVDGSGNPLSDATLIVKNQLTAEMYEWDTDTEAETLSLTPGLYVVSETKAPDGYDKVTDFLFTLSAEGIVSLGYISPEDKVQLEEREITITDKTETHTIDFSKTTIGGIELPGATIQIFKGSDTTGTMVKEWESANTPYKLQLEAGTYTFHEEAAPDGYLAVTNFTFTVDADGKVELGEIKNGDIVKSEGGKITVTDKSKPQEFSEYEISFLKVDEGGNPLSHATLTVKNQLTAQTYTWNTNAEVHTLTLKPGLYVVSETNAPGGYIKVKDFNFTLGADGVILLGDIAPGDVVKLEGRKITITDKAEPHEEEFSVEFSKVKLGGEELPGARIEIYKGDTKIEQWNSLETSTVINLEAGTYRFHEVYAPEGFVAVTDFEFTVEADGSVTLGTIAQGETVVAENGKITVTDNAKKHEVEFSKVKLGGEELPGAKIEIYKGTDKVDGWESTTDSHTLSLEAGTYRFHEEAAPEGFVAVTDFEFTVKADGSVTLGTIAQGETVVAENGKITVTDNAKTTPPTPDKKVGDLTVTKTVSGSRGDQNKEFTFTVTLDRTDITGKYGDMTFTGGVATFTLKHGQSKTASELPAGVAYTVEESDNSGYTVTKTNATGTIQKGVTATAAFENYKGGSGGGGSSHTPQAARVTLTATKTVDGLIPTGSGFTFFLDDANGQRMQEKNNQGSHITFDTLTFTKTGTYVYYITEQTGNDKNINYDTASYKVTVTVTCPYDYEASVSYEKNGQAYHSIPAFANTTKPAVPVQPQTPVVPVQPQTPPVITPSRPLDNVPKTEDNTNLTLWSILAAASLLSLTALLAGNKTRKPHSQGKRNKS